MIRVAVAGAAGRLGQTVCAAVEAAEDLELTGRADPALDTPLASVLGDADVLVDFTRPDTALENARTVLAAGRHVVIGTTGFDLDALREAAEGLELAGRADPALDTPLEAVLAGCDVVVDFTRPDTALDNARAVLAAGRHVVIGTTGFDVDALQEVADGATANAFVAPNFAIGAVLMMRFAAEASRHMQGAEIVEYHHPAKLDAPSGTAARTARLMHGEVPIHSVRLPGIVADQDVILGDVAQTLTIRHATTDRTSFMPGVLMAVRAVADLPERLTVGLERLLWP